MTWFGKSLRRGLGASVVAAMMTLTPGIPGIAAESLPFNDPDAKGYIGFCDQNKRPITSGKLTDQPFIWTAVSSTPAPKGFDKGAATLLAFQPRLNVDPGDWSGRLMTASSTFTNSKHPMSQATYADDPLLFFVQAYPPNWDGLVQLRLYFGAPERGQYKETYPATTIRVSGDRWTVVSGGNVACNVGRAVSIETLTLPKEKLKSPPPLVFNGPGFTPNPQAASGQTQPLASGSGTDSGFSGADIVRLGLLGLTLIAAGTGGFSLWRRRRAAS